MYLNGNLRISCGLILLQIYIFLMPLNKVPKINASGYIGVFFQKLEYADFLLVIILLLLIKDIYVFIKNRKNRAVVITLLMIITSWIISTLYSGTYTSILDTLGLIMLITLFLAVAVIAQNHENIFIINRANFYTGVVISFIGIVMFFVKNALNINIFDSYFAEQYAGNAAVFMDRLSVFTKAPEMLITYINVGVVSGFILWRFDWEKKKYLVLIILMVVVGFMAFSRSLSGLFITLALVAAIYKKTNINNLFAPAVFSFSVLFFFATLLFSVIHLSAVSDRSAKTPKLFDLLVDDRYYMNVAAIDMFTDNPLFGGGPGSYTFNSKKYLNSYIYTKQQYKQISSLASRQLDPHNAYFGLLAENGIAGFILFVIFFSNLLFLRFKKYSDRLSEHATLNYLFMRAGIVGLLVAGIFMDILTLRYLWVLTGMIYSVVNPSDLDV